MVIMVLAINQKCVQADKKTQLYKNKLYPKPFFKYNDLLLLSSSKLYYIIL